MVESGETEGGKNTASFHFEHNKSPQVNNTKRKPQDSKLFLVKKTLVVFTLEPK